MTRAAERKAVAGRGEGFSEIGVLIGLLMAAIALWTLTGIVDFRPVSTERLRQDIHAFEGKDITLRNAAVVGAAVLESNDKNLLLQLSVTNTHQSFSRPTAAADAVAVFARVARDSSFARVVLAKEPSWWFATIHAKVERGMIVMTELPPTAWDSDPNWLTIPYDLTLRIVGSFVALPMASFIALLVQSVVTVIGALIVFYSWTRLT